VLKERLAARADRAVDDADAGVDHVNTLGTAPVFSRFIIGLVPEIKIKYSVL